MKKISKFVKSPVKSCSDILIKRLPVKEESKEVIIDQLSKMSSQQRNIQTQRTIYVVGFSTWKRYIRKYYRDYKLVFINKNISRKSFNQRYRWNILKNIDKSKIFIWGYKAPDFIFEFIKQHDIKSYFVEDGFIRSVELGATKEPPLSLCLDSKAAYFDSTKETDLEWLLNNYDCDEALLERATTIIDSIKKFKISKYNHAKDINIEDVYGTKSSKRILVVGQVEDDASIKYGGIRYFNNNDLVKMAVVENPGAQVIYKVHPDVFNGHRDSLSNPLEVKDICHILQTDVPLANALETIDHVYTMTSLSGLEALIRGIKVTTVGAPFYSGWGLTEDRCSISRRQRTLSLDELFAISYIVYPKYFDANTGNSIKIEEVIKQLISLKQAKKLVSEQKTSHVSVESIPAQGIYRHYKGNLYQVLHTARHSETEEVLVVYRCLYGEYDVWVRPLTMFTESVSVDGKQVPRFELIKPLTD